MYNKVVLIGNLGRDPEVRYTQSNDPIVSFSLATSESWYDKKENLSKTITEWHRIVILNPKIANVAKQYLVKGSKVYLEGKIRTRSWMDGEQKRVVVEVILDFSGVLRLLDTKGSSLGIVDSYLTDEAMSEELDLNQHKAGFAQSVDTSVASSGNKNAIDFDDIPF